jgi:Bacterial membrane protein YfhO
MIKPYSRTEYVLVAVIYMVVTYIIWSVLEPWLQIEFWANNDNRNYHPDMIAYGMSRVMDGEWPLWNPYQAGGLPFFAALQGMVLYPPSWLALIFSADTTHVITKYIHLVVSGFSVYFYLRVLKLHGLAAFLGGLFFMTGNFYLQFAVFEAAAYPLATIGFLLAAAEKIFQTSSGPYDSTANKWSLFFVIVLTLQVFAGYIQSVVFIGYFLCLYIPFRIWQLYLRDQDKRTIFLPFIRFGVIAVLAVMLASIQLVPTFEMSTYSATHNVGKGMDMSNVNIYFLPSPSFEATLRDVIVPISSKPAHMLFWGLMVGGLVFCKRFRPLIGFYLFTTVLFMTLARGPETPLYQYYYNYFPTGNWFRWPEKFLLMSNFTISILVGIGVHQCHQFLSKRAPAPINHVLWLYCFGIFSVAFLLRYSTLGVEIEQPDWRLKVFGKNHEAYESSKLAGNMTDLLQKPAKFRIYEQDPFVDAEPALAFLKEQNSHDRTVSLLMLSWIFVPDLPVKWGMREQLYSIEDYEPLLSSRYENFLGEMGDAGLPHVEFPKNTQLMSLFSTKWLLVSKHWLKRNPVKRKTLPKDLVRVYRDKHYVVFELPDFIPRSYISKNIVSLPDEQVLDFLSNDSFDPSTQVVVDETSSVPETQDNGPIIETQIVDYQPEKITIALPPEGSDGILVLTDNFDVNWRATVDGEPAEIIPVNYLFRGVEVSSKNREVVFTYHPVYFYYGAAISVLAVILMLAFFLVGPGRFSRAS